jgi:hypothetical protein
VPGAACVITVEQEKPLARSDQRQDTQAVKTLTLRTGPREDVRRS